MLFESVAVEYDRARPSYPDGIYDALGSLTGVRVLDVGAGTGIATRQLASRGAVVVAVDPGRHVLTRATERTVGLPAVVADGAALPVGNKTVDLICFAQAWHWLDPKTRCAETHRVLRDTGRWAGWWSHARADDEAWFNNYWSLIERHCAGTHRGQRNIDWGQTVAQSGLFVVHDRIDVPWTRCISIDEWLIDQSSHSYVASLAPPTRNDLLSSLRELLTTQFPYGEMTVRYETWLWTATKR